MADYNWSSILKKAQAAVTSDSVQTRIDNVVDGIVFGTHKAESKNTIQPIRDAAYKFTDVLFKEINSCAGSVPAVGQLGPTAISALSNINIDSPVKTGKYRYEIGVSFSGVLNRDSLDPSYFTAGIDNIAALLNNGYSAASTVYGVWLNHSPWNIQSLTSRSGAHFIDNAVSSFQTGHAPKYGVINIDVDDIYK
jgi:hypothetical protein